MTTFNKIYLRYSDYIDQGYSINLIIIPKKFLEIFSRFNDFFLNSISSGNNFLKKYNIYGWSLSIRREAKKEYLFIFKNFLRILLLSFLN